MKYTPEMNDGKHVFVFGSNLAGRHGKGAALQAAKHWGALRGVGDGPYLQSYAIPTKDKNLKIIPLDDIEFDVGRFLDYAREHCEVTFLVTAIGCGLAGYTPQEIAPMFKGAPKNCVLPEEFTAVIENQLTKIRIQV